VQDGAPADARRGLDACVLLLRLAKEQDAHHDRRRLHERHDGHHVSAVVDAGVVEDARRGQKGDGADRSIAGGDGGGIVHAELQPKQPEERERHGRGQRDAERDRDHGVAVESAGCDLDAAREADRPQQVERQELGHGPRHAKVGPHERRDGAEHEEQDGRTDVHRASASVLSDGSPAVDPRGIPAGRVGFNSLDRRGYSFVSPPCQPGAARIPKP